MSAFQQALLSDVSGAGGGQTPYGAAVTLNPLDKGAGVALSGGNLVAATTPNGFTNGYSVRATAAAPAGISVCECLFGANTGDLAMFGIATLAAALAQYPGFDTHAAGLLQANGDVYSNNVLVQTNSQVFVTGSVCGMVINNTAGTIKFYLNGMALAGGAYTHGLGATIYAIAGANPGGSNVATVTINFGATAFAYTYS
jgi:hypothetical protein